MLIIRGFKPADLGDVMELVSTNFREQYRPDMYMTLYNNWREGLFVAVSSGRIIGFVLGIKSNPMQARVLILVVEKYHRARGIGKELMHEIMKRSAASGIREIVLEVRKSNELAQLFYHNLGFEFSGIIPRYYSDGEDGYQMSKQI